MIPHALLLPVLAAVAVVALGSGVLRLLAARRDASRTRERALAGARPGSTDASFTGTMQALGTRVSGGKASRTLKEELASAGWHARSAAAIYLGSKMLLLAAGALGSTLALLPLELPLALRGFLTAVIAVTLFFVPNVVVAVKRHARREEVRRHLPDAIDMLEICVSSGMGLDAAWTAVSDEIRRVSDIFSDEMELTTLEMSLGVDRPAAMRHMAERTGAEDLSSLVALLVQSERFGASIAEALTTFARSLREIRGQRAQEAAEKMSVKLLFPMVMFIFPALLAIMVGPAVLELMESLG